MKSIAFNTASPSLLHWMTSATTGRGPLYGFRHGTLIVGALVVLVTGLAGSSSARYGLTLSTVFAIAVLGNNAVTGMLGQISLSGGAFMALGAYTFAIALQAGVPVPWALAAAVFAAAAVGALIAVPTSRLRGLFTALVTFALAASVPDVATYLKKYTGGDTGIYVDAQLGFGGLTFSGSNGEMLVLAVLAFTIVGLLHLRLLNGRAGRIAITVGEAEQAAAVFGQPNHGIQVAVWAWASALAGLSGALYAMTVGYVNPHQFSLHLSLYLFVGGFLGGVRSVSGAWIGGLLMGIVPMWLQDVVPASAVPIAFGAILIIGLALGGKGLSEIVDRLAVRAAARLGWIHA